MQFSLRDLLQKEQGLPGSSEAVNHQDTKAQSQIPEIGFRGFFADLRVFVPWWLNLEPHAEAQRSQRVSYNALMKYSLRSLVVATVIGPPVLAVAIRVVWMLSGSEAFVLLGKCLVCLSGAIFVGFMIAFWVEFFGKRLAP